MYQTKRQIMPFCARSTYLMRHRPGGLLFNGYISSGDAWSNFLFFWVRIHIIEYGVFYTQRHGLWKIKITICNGTPHFDW